MKKSKFRQMSTGDRVFTIVNYSLLMLVLIIELYPLVYVVAASFSDPQAVVSGKVFLFPVNPTLKGYAAVFKNKKILTGFSNSIFYLIVGTVLNLVMTMLCAYPLSRKEFRARGFLSMFFVFTMYFSGGIIPTFLVVKNLGMYDSLSSLYIPQAINVFNFIVMRTFFRQLPESLEEAAKIDGASDMGVLLKIVLPLSVPIIATIGLFYAVQYWNSYFDALIYIQSPDKFTLQLRLRSLLFADELNNAGGGNVEGIGTQVMTQSLKMACVAVSTIPILLVYPWLQKYFVKGVMLGSVKG